MTNLTQLFKREPLGSNLAYTDVGKSVGQRQLSLELKSCVVHCSEKSSLMTEMGQSLPKFDVCVTSAFHPIATKSRTFRHFGFGPSADLMHCKSLHSAKEHSNLTLGLRLKLNY